MLGGASPTTENNTAGGTKRKKKSSRRFSDEQIKSLETLFNRENKLEPRKKLELARELGLHPRQVAIWFQNRRARWKSKQVEQDYSSLKADYDTLSRGFESLKKEKHDLLQQLSNLYSQLNVDSGSREQDTADEDDPINHNKDMPPADPCNFHDLGSLFDHSCGACACWDGWPSNS